MWETLPAVWDNGTASLSVCCGAKVEVWADSPVCLCVHWLMNIPSTDLGSFLGPFLFQEVIKTYILSGNSEPPQEDELCL